jgi:E3 ubiquitin-protein ligase BRE1
MSRKASSLRAKTEASSVLDKVQQEVNEYRGILKCGVCRDRQKEVNAVSFISCNLDHHIYHI